MGHANVDLAAGFDIPTFCTRGGVPGFLQNVLGDLAVLPAGAFPPSQEGEGTVLAGVQLDLRVQSGRPRGVLPAEPRLRGQGGRGWGGGEGGPPDLPGARHDDLRKLYYTEGLSLLYIESKDQLLLV